MASVRKTIFGKNEEARGKARSAGYLCTAQPESSHGKITEGRLFPCRSTFPGSVLETFQSHIVFRCDSFHDTIKGKSLLLKPRPLREFFLCLLRPQFPHMPLGSFLAWARLEHVPVRRESPNFTDVPYWPLVALEAVHHAIPQLSKQYRL